jgi:hypothetical protein
MAVPLLRTARAAQVLRCCPPTGASRGATRLLRSCAVPAPSLGAVVAAPPALRATIGAPLLRPAWAGRLGLPQLRRQLCGKPAAEPQPSAQQASAAAGSSAEPAPGGIRAFFKKYGKTGFAIYISVYLTTLGSLFAVIDNGILAADDAVKFLKKIGVDRFVDLDRINPKAGSFAVAWILAKFTEPFRMALTLAITPSVVKLLLRRKP